MKIAIIGSTAYEDKMHKHKDVLIGQLHEVHLPAFDNFAGMNEYEVGEFNRSQIEWADEVHVFWDGRSTGTIFDIGMCFALRKVIRLIYLNHRTFNKFFKLYNNKCIAYDIFLYSRNKLKI